MSLLNSKSFLEGNIYSPPDLKVQYNDRFAHCMDIVINEDKEFVLLGEFNKNLLNEEIDRD